MPPTHVECCGELWTIAEAAQHTAQRDNRCEWTQEILTAMLAAQSAHPSAADGTRISTTVLTNKCLRRLAYERTLGFTVTPASLWAAFRGTMFHAQLERWAAPGSYGEARFYVDDMATKIPSIGVTLPGDVDRSFSGSPDLVDPVAGIVYDYKRTKEVPRFNTVWGDHQEQLNINRWLVDHGDRVELVETDRAAFLEAVGLDYRDVPGLLDYRQDASGEITATYDMSVPEVRSRFVAPEWTSLVIVYADDKGPKPITVEKTVPWTPEIGGRKRPKARVPDVWDEERTERFIAERYVKGRLAFLAGNAPIPKGWEHQSHALCQFCNVRKECAINERLGL